MATSGFVSSEVQALFEKFLVEVESGRQPNTDEYANGFERREDRLAFFQLVEQYLEMREWLPEPEETPMQVGGYRIKHPLARGGMGQVFVAEDEDGKEYALKVLPEALLFHPSAGKRFAREVDILTELNHANVVPVVARGEENGRPYLVMPLLKGGSLEDRLNARRAGDEEFGPETIPETCAMIAKVAHAAHAAHQSGIVHRDIKPGNIVFDEAGEPYLADFGLAHLDHASTMTTQGKVMGTPAYLAPERLLEPEASSDPRVDVYSLGVTLFESTVGVRPYQGDLAQVLAAARWGPPSMQVLVGRETPRALQAIVERAMADTPSQRYPSAVALARDLEALLAGRSVKAVAGHRRRALWRRVRRRPWQYGIGAATFVILAAFGAYFFAQNQFARHRVNALLEQAETPEAEFRAATARIDRILFADGFPGVNNWSTRPEEGGGGVLPGAEPRRLKLEAHRSLAEANLRTAETSLREATGGPREDAVRARLAALQHDAAIWLERDGRYAEADRRWAEHLALAGLDPAEAGSATLRIESKPAGAFVDVLRYQRTPEDRWKLTRVTDRQGLRTPFTAHDLMAGSYLLEIRRTLDSPTVRLPVLLHREEQRTVASINVPPDDWHEDGWVYLPPGRMLVGGSVAALDPEPRAFRDLDGDYFMKVHEVTIGEYREFLVAHLDAGMTCLHEQITRVGDGPVMHTPRAASYSGHKFSDDQSRNGRDEDSFFCDGNAVHDIAPMDALHYVWWLNERAEANGQPWRYALPTGDQWEWAARGADGRPYPWGDGFGLEWVHTGRTKSPFLPKGEPAFMPGSYPIDTSVFGIADMAGSMREFCLDLDSSINRRLIRGGEASFYYPQQFLLASRTAATDAEVNWNFGIRLIRYRVTE